jgi:hypothetical protein
MKQFLALALAAGAVLFNPALAADVGVSVQIGQPGFYGRIDIGRFPQPQVVYPQPVVIVPAPVAVVQAPLYLRVPPGHSKHWAKHCSKYNACGQPVYFVQDQWYQSQVVQAHYGQRDRDHRHDQSEGKHRGNDQGRSHGRGHRDD